MFPLICLGAGDDIGNRPYGLSEALTTGHANIQLRPRYNRIDESDKSLLTEGGTVRALAGWRSAPWQGLRLTVEAIHTDYLGRKRFNEDGAQFFSSPYPLLPDPRYTGVNQAHIEYASVGGLRLKLGRQLVHLDNQRWVSDNDFRQIPQLFDGASASYAGIANTELLAGYFSRLRDTSGEVENVKLTLLRAAWNPARGHSLAAYAYFHDQPVTSNFTGFANSSYRIAGLRAEGALQTSMRFEVPYVLEVAQQKPFAGGDARVDARYWRVGAGLSADAWTVRADMETRGSNNGVYGLQAPLTDYYAFNGWTLHFFTVPKQGLRDRWITARHAVGPITLFGEAHRFKSDFGGLDLGRENDLGVTWEALPNAIVRLQHARYDPGDGLPAPTIRKTWLTLDYTF
ncbi:MAG: alginate export family protein [Usitatibacter sp.]